MFFKKIFSATVIFLLFGAVVFAAAGAANISEVCYRCHLETVNPGWHILFFLFRGDNRRFLWRDKSGSDENGKFQEITVYNKNRQVIRFFARGDVYEAKIDFGTSAESGELTPAQAKIWFEILKFVRSAAPGEVFRSPYRTKNADYEIEIEAREKGTLRTSRGEFAVIRFEGKVFKGTEKFLDIKFWISGDGALRGQIVRCSFKKSFWPTVILEIE